SHWIRNRRGECREVERDSEAMSRKRESASLNHISSEWGPNHEVAVILAAAFRHSDENVRSALRDRLDGWVQRRRPIHKAEAIARALGEDPATALEPFRLADERLALAVLPLSSSLLRSCALPVCPHRERGNHRSGRRSCPLAVLGEPLL